jgi:hypothetical protein
MKKRTKKNDSKKKVILINKQRVPFILCTNLYSSSSIGEGLLYNASSSRRKKKNRNK